MMEIDLDYAMIMGWYNWQCLMCPSTQVTLHEIVPKSKAPKTWMDPENRVPLCLEHHEEIHRMGTRKSEVYLKALALSVRDGV